MPSQRRPQGRNRRRGGRRDTNASKKPKIQVADLAPTLDPPNIENFREWEALGTEIHDALAAQGITNPTPIQRLAIGPVLEGKDVIAKAETGTGKTLGFGAPMMAKIDPDRATVLGLVLCPTRELAQQVCDVLKMLGEARGISVALVVGGDPMHPQIRELQAGAQVVVGTPGRVLDLAAQRFLSFPWLEFAVLDEADKMFEIGFADDVRKILAMTPDERQTLLFSATFPPAVLELARNSTTDPIEVATAKGPSTVTSIDQKWCTVDEDERALTLIRMFEDGKEDDVFLIFCERRSDVDQLMRRLERSKFAIKALHGGYDQAARFRVMTAYRTGDIKALVATDVASRGLDVDHVTHVVNFSVPRELEDYTHRIGRTGRAGRQGTAITFVIRREMRKWRELIGKTDWDIEEFEPRRTRYPKRDRGERRPRRHDRDDEDRPRRERGERRPRRDGEGDGERPRRRRPSDENEPKRERGERRPRREDEGEERPRRRRQRSSEDGERSERRDEDRPRRSERSRGEREERPRRENSEEKPRSRRGEREERRPRRRRESSERDGDEKRESRERGRGGSRRGRDEERPRRERSTERAPAQSDAPFGHLGDEPAEKPKRRERKRRPRRTDEAREGRREEAPARRSESRPSSSDGGFGAGLD